MKNLKVTLPVPELALLGVAGLAGLAFLRRR
jgi:MYXO-CTERM domain-containing protein